MTVAATVHRLAILLAAGIPPLSAWGYLAAGSAPVAPVRAAADVGSPDLVAAAIIRSATGQTDEPAWRCVAAAWRVATEVGAPLSPTLTRLADVLTALDESRREVEVALAGPRATSRIMAGLPVLGLGFGSLLGFDTAGVLFGTPPGLACLVVGVGLWVIGGRWNRRLLTAARAVDPTPGLALELLGIALSGGVAIERGLHIAEDALRAAGLAPIGTAADDLIAFSQVAGVPIAALLRGEALEQRRDARAEIGRRSAELGTRLLLPLGVCVLPSFLALGVVPLLISVVSSTAAVL